MEFAILISVAHHDEQRRVSLLVVLFHNDLPISWSTSVAHLSSMTQFKKFARLLAGNSVEPISSRTARHIGPTACFAALVGSWQIQQ